MGVDKARLPFGSETVLERVISSVTPLELPIYLVCAAYEEAEDERTTWLRSFELPIVADLHPDLGPLGGLHTALSKTGAELLLLLACDLPFLSTPFLSRVLSVEPADVIIPGDKDGLHPLCAVYRRSCLEGLNRRIENARLGLIDFVRSVDFRVFPNTEYADLDPDGLLLTNLNSTEDYERAVALLAQKPESNTVRTNRIGR